MHHVDDTPKLYGLLAEFDSPTAIVDAARKAREAGYVKLDAYTPFPIHELDEALKLPRTIAAAGSCSPAGSRACSAASRCEYWMSVDRLPAEHRRPSAGELAGVRHSRVRDDDPVRVDHGGGRDDRAERAAACRITRCSTRPTSPTRSADRFFLCIETKDAKFDAAGTRQFLEGLHPLGVTDVAE